MHDRLLFGLEVVEEHVPLLALLTPITDDYAGAVDDFARISFSVENAQARPLAQQLAIGNFDQRNLMFRAQRNNELLVSLLFTSFIQNTHVGLATVEGFAGLAKAAGETVVDEGEL